MPLCSYSYPLGTDPFTINSWEYDRWVKDVGPPQQPPQQQKLISVSKLHSRKKYQISFPATVHESLNCPTSQLFWGFVRLLTLSNMMNEERWIILTFNSTFDYWWGKTHFNMYWQFVQCTFYFVICLFVFISQFFYWIFAFLLLVYKLSLSLSFCAN